MHSDPHCIFGQSYKRVHINVESLAFDVGKAFHGADATGENIIDDPSIMNVDISNFGKKAATDPVDGHLGTYGPLGDH